MGLRATLLLVLNRLILPDGLDEHSVALSRSRLRLPAGLVGLTLTSRMLDIYVTGSMCDGRVTLKLIQKRQRCASRSPALRDACGQTPKLISHHIAARSALIPVAGTGATTRQGYSVTIVLLLLLAGERQVFRPVSADEATWSAPATWDQSPLVPAAEDRVLLPGNPRQKSSIVIPANESANISSMMIGDGRLADGTLSIFGDLRVDGASVEADKNRGRIYVGRQRGTGTVMQHAGSIVTLTRSLRIAHQARGRGEYYVHDGELTVGRDIQIAAEEGTEGLLDLAGSASVTTNNVRMGSGKARLQFTASDIGVPQVTTRRLSELSGALRVDLQSFTKTPTRIRLIRTASRSGGFRQVRIFTPPGVDYELRYANGSRADVYLNRLPRPWASFEEWRDARFQSKDPHSVRGPFADPDGDGVPNVGEYRLGCCPLTNEGLPFQLQTNSQNETYFRFVERTDRSDVRVVPQASRDGRVWLSTLVTRRVIQKTGTTRAIRVTGKEPGLKFRLAFEMLPTRGVKPNVLFVVIDDLNTWTEGLGGHPETLTPNLNRIAARGIQFTRAYATVALCNPSRISFLTGRRPTTTGVYGNGARIGDSPPLEGVATFPEHFKTNGYHIAGAGKLFHNRPELKWNQYFPSLKENRIKDPLPPNRPLSGIRSANSRSFDWGPLDVSDEEMGDVQVAQWCANRLRNPPRQPFLLTCGFFRPHLPFYVPPKYFAPWTKVELPLGLLRGDENDLPAIAREWINEHSDHNEVVRKNQWRAAVRAYLACVHFADAQLGKVLDALENSPAMRNTIVIVTSDHGWHFGEKTHWRKNSLWEADCRVPLIVSAPGITRSGTECHEVVSLLDLYPTLNELCDLPSIDGLEGTSFGTQLRTPSVRRGIPALTTRYYNHTVRDRRWRYIRYEDGSEELYDHTQDRFEHNNLALDPQYKTVMKRLERWIPAEQYPPLGGL